MSGEWQETLGAVVLSEIPKTELIDRAGFALGEEPTREQFEQCADWCRVRGATVPLVNDDGLLVVSNYLDDGGLPDGERYYDFVRGGLLIHNPRNGEITGYGHSMLACYGLSEPRPFDTPAAARPADPDRDGEGSDA